MTPLSSREREVIERIVAGLSYKEIAHALGISVSEAGTYAHRAYSKMGEAAPRRLVGKNPLAPERTHVHNPGQ